MKKRATFGPETMQLLGIERYVPYVGEEAIAAVFKAARPLYGLRVLEINATFHGGGVAGMLHSLIPLMNDVGIDANWNLLYGDPNLFQVTKKLHNALQGEPVELTEREVADYLRVNEAFARYSPVADHDVIIVHDPQPLPMVRYHQRVNPWVWRCHIDISNPHPAVWEMLKPFILRYDAVVVSSEAFRKPDLPAQTHIIPRPLTPSPISAGTFPRGRWTGSSASTGSPGTSRSSSWCRGSISGRTPWGCFGCFSG
ncbi:MAG: hypothetical protein ABID40_04095 [Candidatus Bipolaricaulota bacterium]